jgi:hypothetical protein
MLVHFKLPVRESRNKLLHETVCVWICDLCDLCVPRISGHPIEIDQLCWIARDLESQYRAVAVRRETRKP